MASLEACGTGCGLLAAFIGCLGSGSFGAPLKCKAVDMVNGGKGPDAFVLQTYKSTMYFLTSWLVLLLGVDFEFTPWGILSGIMWVTGGVCGIFGIRNAGLAISVATWSSIAVLISFCWGIFFFGEQVQSVSGTVFGIIMMIIGFIGMAYFSSFEDETIETPVNEETSLELTRDLAEPLLEIESEMNDGNNEENAEDAAGENDGSPIVEASQSSKQDDDTNDNMIAFCGRNWERKRVGVLGASVDGFLGGSVLIPMKLAPSIDRGLDYVISFAIGAACATILGWVLYFSVNSYREQSFVRGYKALPSLYLDKIVMPGALSGVLWSIGNVSQILAVTFLGESIGVSLCQSQMIISGLLGIVLFEEIKGNKRIVSWVSSALITFVGIVFLSTEHKS